MAAKNKSGIATTKKLNSTLCSLRNNNKVKNRELKIEILVAIKIAFAKKYDASMKINRTGK